jgi:hypothetical protein
LEALCLAYADDDLGVAGCNHRTAEDVSKFYGEVLGLKQVTNEKGWNEFATGGARIALHSGPSSPGRERPNIVFYAKDVAALPKTLLSRDASFGRSGKRSFALCDGRNPDGSPIQLSNR